MELNFVCLVSGGKLPKSISEKIKTALLGFENKEIEIILTDESSRTAKQNRLWWLYVTILSNELGETKNDTHELLKTRFMPFAKSTTELSKQEFNHLINELVTWSAQYLNVILPEPHE
ncbi:hypothetical protein UFOVP87_38 [uncultured Caudovirales phage]|uniref:Recombinase NinB n=1 Tax=uncultured Caudovirales phage TaxID=2100421 RepID=A0A6J5L0I0_9CAUD|nr:hypothetical protein UFOVP87_38 [uncultured Caudovirales phage]